MKKISVEQLPAEMHQVFVDAQQQRVVVLRNGEPFAVIQAVGNKDEEDLDLEESPEFWQMIRERRREKATESLEELKAEIAAGEQRLQTSHGTTPVDQPVPRP
jgi:PHD/YefM family antitoxin component YafN of YafNO toxin-antitoxin module